MSSFAGYCNVCGKPVMHKTLFGTLHLCLTDEEIKMQASQLQMNQQQSNVGQPELLKRLKEMQEK